MSLSRTIAVEAKTLLAFYALANIRHRERMLDALRMIEEIDRIEAVGAAVAEEPPA